MKKKIALSMCILSFYSVCLTQESNIVNDGIYVRILSEFNNLSGDIEGYSYVKTDASVTANIKGSLGLGAALGYRFHSKGTVDGSLEISYTSSQHKVEYHYPSLSSITFGANSLSGSDTLGINSVSFHSISLDIDIYFFRESHLQPYFTFGYELYLNQIHLKSIPLSYNMSVDHYGYFGNSAIHYITIESIPYIYEKKFSSGGGLHIGAGLSYYILSNLVCSGSIRVSFRSLNEDTYGTVSYLCIDFGGSIAVIL